jgi:hypothetical protein
VSGSDSLDVLNLFGDELGHSVLERLGVSSLARRESPRESGSDLVLSALSSRFLTPLWIPRTEVLRAERVARKLIVQW